VVRQLILALTLLGMLLAAAVTVVEAQAPEPECDLVYTVQAGDWLSKIAEKYLGDVLAYDQLVELANASGDDEFSDIENPDLIEPGWVICIVSNETLTMPADEESTAQPEPESDLYAVLESMEHTPDPDLIDKVWAWERRDPNGNPIEEIIVPDPENYLLSFAADGTFVTKMNCRNALGEYASSSPAETVNSMAGQLKESREATIAKEQEIMTI